MSENQGNYERAKALNELIRLMSIFSRKTILEWLPNMCKQYDVTGEEVSILYELDMSANQSLKRLSQNLLAAPSNISVAIQHMVDQGLVVRQVDLLDRRKITLNLSEKGYQLLGHINEQLIHHFQRYLEKLPVQQSDVLHTANLVMLEVLRNILIKNEE